MSINWRWDGLKIRSVNRWIDFIFIFTLAPHPYSSLLRRFSVHQIGNSQYQCRHFIKSIFFQVTLVVMRVKSNSGHSIMEFEKKDKIYTHKSITHIVSSRINVWGIKKVLITQLWTTTWYAAYRSPHVFHIP